jgi:hypothetical protein
MALFHFETEGGAEMLRHQFVRGIGEEATALRLGFSAHRGSTAHGGGEASMGAMR